MKVLFFIMYEEILTKFGLIPNEAKVYEALLELGESSVQKISLKAGIHRRTVYDELKKLSDKGLVIESMIKGEKRFVCNNPNKLLEILKEKENMISSVMPGLKAKFEETPVEEEAKLYKGIEGVKNYLQDILDTGEDVYFIGAKAMWLDPRLKHFLANFKKERKKRGIKFYHIFDWEVKERQPEILRVVGRPYKFLPKEYSSPTMVDIFGPYVVTFIGVSPGQLPTEPIQFVMKSRKLADGYRQFWKFMWDNLPEE
jgi:predicted transcriptional regulator